MIPLSSDSPELSPARPCTRREVLKLAGMGLALAALPQAFAEALPAGNFAAMAGTHDLSLPDWGPYSKKYLGISHIADVARGISFDLSLFPRLEGQPGGLPSAHAPGNVHPWEAAPGLEMFTLRTGLPGQDPVLCDLSFVQREDGSRLVRVHLANRTGREQRLTLNSLAQLSYPPLRENTCEPIRLVRAELPAGALWVHALDYTELRYATPRPSDNLVEGGYLRGEERAHDAVGGSVIAQRFGQQAGDTVRYRFSVPKPFADAVLLWRFLGPKGAVLPLRMQGAASREVRLEGNGAYTTAAIPLGAIPAGPVEVTFTSAGGDPVSLNGFVLVERQQTGQVRFFPTPWQREPRIDTTSVPGSTILGYDDLSSVYGLRLGRPLGQDHRLTWRELDGVFGPPDPRTRERRDGSPEHQQGGDPDCIFVHARTEPLRLAPKEETILYGLLCTGPKAEVAEALRRFDPTSPAHERLYASASAKAYRPRSTPAGERLRLGQQLMAAVTLTSLVFPIYTQRQYIRHYTPGRRWDSLYTWDSGFHGLGLLEIDPARAIDILNVYTTAPGAQSAFLLHGSPLPVQIYLYAELWSRTQSRAMLAYFYPRMLRIYRFLAGRLGSSTTRQHQDRLLCTWDYWYNTGGWDDYPPQVYVHAHKLAERTAPVVSSAHLIRCAKLLRLAAKSLGEASDLAEFDRDIAELGGALQRHSWDEGSGYYGYVTHDAAGAPTGILRHASGKNFNMGLDGVAPLVAGICTPAQEAALIERIFSPKHLWSETGISTVDQSAPYYDPNGYWNGNVWMAHQWFLWKTMLDLGRGELAIRIAETGLETWRRSTDATWNCYEHFRISDRAGRDWPQFPSLSSPVLPWFGSLYTPGRLTCGFEVWLELCEFAPNNRGLRARLRTAAAMEGRRFTVLACMEPGVDYRVLWNGEAVMPRIVHERLLQIELPYQSEVGELRIESST